MFNLESYINLPYAWGALILIAVSLYVLLDGFGLGVGILFPFAPTNYCRDKMMNSVAPFWDGNETWLILGGGGLFAAFPKAFAIIMPAMYMPILFMLLALIFRGVSFEMRFKVREEKRYIWDIAFHFGSLVAAFMQGCILGGVIQGIKVKSGQYVGSSFDWLTAFSLLCGVALVAGYTMLGATWLILKTKGVIHSWAQKTTKYILPYVLFFLFLVCIWTPFLDKSIWKIWYSFPDSLWLLIIPLGVIFSCYFLCSGIKKNCDIRPFVGALLIFLFSLFGLMVSFWPFVVPRSVTFVEAAATGVSQSLMLVGALIVLPVILSYTAYSYYVFRGKVSSEAMY